MSDIIILGIETSCDETAAAVVRNGREVLSSVIFSQDMLHERYGGVVPEIASRAHIDKISFCVDAALTEAEVTFAALSAVAVTHTPGLVGALLVGVSYAKALSFALKKPLIGVNHIEGHICANYIAKPRLKPPFICLVASGGHTSLYLVKTYDTYQIIGQTVDDAAGEAFDKTARIMGLGYPGGRALEQKAKDGDPNALTLPYALCEEGNFNFSFSGLKSAVKRYAEEGKHPVQDIAASFQKVVVDVLVQKTVAAALLHKTKTVAIAGGVCANETLRQAFTAACRANKLTLCVPDICFCTDNACMIAVRAYFDYCQGRFADLRLNANSRGEFLCP